MEREVKIAYISINILQKCINSLVILNKVSVIGNITNNMDQRQQNLNDIFA
jgi:hypothetical protein